MSTHMGSMNISIRDGVYRELKRRRAEGESFSDVLERLMREPARLTDFIGAWADMDESEFRGVRARRAIRRKADAERTGRLRARADR